MIDLEARVKIELLEKEMTGLRKAVAALALVLGRQSPETAEALDELLAASAVHAKFTLDPAAELPIRALIRDISILRGVEPDPARGLLVLALQAKDAGAARRPALDAWLAQASVDELTDDVLQLLQKYGLLAPGDGAPEQSG